MTPSSHDTLAAFVGIDWAAATHDGGLPATGSAKRECGEFAHTPEAIDAGGTTLRTRFNGHPVALCLALTTGPLVCALRTDDFLVLCPLHPLTVARYRAACTPSRATDDPPDAELQLALLLPHRDTLPPLHPPSPPRRALAPLVAHRRRVVGETVRMTNRLTRTLKNSFPQVLQWFQDKDTPMFCDCLSRWPPRTAAHLARRATLERCFRAHHGRSADGIAQRLQAITTATPFTTDAGVSAPNALLGQALVAHFRVPLQAIAEFDTAIAPWAQSPPDFPLFQALPGAGPVFAPRLLVACGEQRARYTSAAALPKYAGIAPVTARSGKKAWVHWRLQCPKCLRQTFVAWAAASIRHACWAQVSYQQQREKGTPHQAAVRALAFKWIRILLRCWQHRTPYDASVYLNALQRRGSPLMHNRANVV
jgi:transposase